MGHLIILGKQNTEVQESFVSNIGLWFSILIVVRLVTIECIPYTRNEHCCYVERHPKKRGQFSSIWTELDISCLPNKRWLICMTTKLQTGKVCLPSRPQAIAFLERRRKLTGLFSASSGFCCYGVQIYISHLLRPTDLKKFVATKMQFFWEKKKRNPFDLFGQSLLTYIERRLLRKAKKGEEEGKLRGSAHIFSLPFYTSWRLKTCNNVIQW